MNNDTQRMSRTVRDILARIDDVFAKGATTQKGETRDYWDVHARSARQLWDILSALRGPDSENRSLKHATTAIIRAAAFPKTYGDGNNNVCIPATMNHDSGDDNSSRSVTYAESSHFTSHARKAFNVLGLKWDNVNTPDAINMAAMPFKAVKKLGKTTKRKPKSKSARR